jgi:hypothetical protein
MGGRQIGGEVGGDRVAQLLGAHLGDALGRNRGVDDGDVEIAEIVLRRLTKRSTLSGSARSIVDALALADLADALEPVLEMLRIR